MIKDESFVNNLLELARIYKEGLQHKTQKEMGVNDAVFQAIRVGQVPTDTLVACCFWKW